VQYANEDERLVAEQAVLNYRELMGVMKIAPHGKGMTAAHRIAIAAVNRAPVALKTPAVPLIAAPQVNKNARRPCTHGSSLNDTTAWSRSCCAVSSAPHASMSPPAARSNSNVELGASWVNMVYPY